MRVTTHSASPATLALAAALGASLAGAHTAAADPSTQGLDHGPSLTLLSPASHATYQGNKPIEIDALYEGSPDNKIVSLDLYIDGEKAQSQSLDTPEQKGMVSFLVDASLMTPGTHYVVVRATAADAEVRSVRSAFVYQADATVAPSAGGDPNALEWSGSPGDAPQMRLVSPTPNGRVQGIVTIKVDASDVSGKPPYVSIFVDGEMKQLVNYRPFEFNWDTTTLSNGWHTIAVVEAFDDDAAAVAHLNPIRVYVNNPGGQTNIRTDLQDGLPTVKPAIAEPVIAARPPLRKTPASGISTRRPRGEALLSVPIPPALHPQAAHHALIAEMNPRWDGPAMTVAPALSAPTLPKVPVVGHKPLPSKQSLLQPSGTPLTATMPVNKHSHLSGARPVPPTLLAEAGPLDEMLTSPLLSLPEIPEAVAPSHTAVVVPRASTAKVLRMAIPEPRIPALHLRMQMPVLPLQVPAAVKTHVALGGASLLRAVGEEQVQFDHKILSLERPLAVHQNVLFGPLRRIFEYGGGSLQWDAHTGVVRAHTAARDVRLTIGEREASLNRRPFLMDGTPYVSSGRTMVPLSFVGAAMDANIQYDPTTGHLKITSRQ